MDEKNNYDWDQYYDAESDGDYEEELDEDGDL